jgi:hypothetical protein
VYFIKRVAGVSTVAHSKMKVFKLHNKLTERDLIYPSIGRWVTPDIEEAREMQDALRVHLKNKGMDFMCEEIVIIDVAEGTEVQ